MRPVPKAGKLPSPVRSPNPRNPDYRGISPSHHRSMECPEQILRPETRPPGTRMSDSSMSRMKSETSSFFARAMSPGSLAMLMEDSTRSITCHAFGSPLRPWRLMIWDLQSTPYFEPDPGRATRLSTSLAGETRNAAVLSQAADLLTRFLVWAAEAKPTIGGRDFEPRRFWTSVWRIFSKFRQDEESQSARNRLLSAIWARNSGYGMLILEHPVLPNELAEDQGGLTSVRSIRFQTADYLNSDHGRTFLRVRRCPGRTCGINLHRSESDPTR